MIIRWHVDCDQRSVELIETYEREMCSLGMASKGSESFVHVLVWADNLSLESMPYIL